jgi:RND superfamily putative drug exporter
MADAQAINDQIQAMTEEPGSNVLGVVSVFTLPQAQAEFLSVDGTAMTMVVPITGSTAEEPYLDRIEAIREVTEPFGSAELAVKVSGPGGLIADLVAVFEGIDGFLLLVTVSLVLVLLIIIYRSPVAALVPVLLVGIVFQLANGVGAVVLDAVDFPVNGQATGIMTVILFGAGTDYVLFISSRYREELARVEDKHEAMRRTMRGVGEAIASAGSTLMVASLLLLLADLGSYRSLGPAIAIAIGLMMLAGLTLVPAVQTTLGRFSFWPFRPRYEPAATAQERYSPIWSRVARFVLNRPVMVLTATTAILLLMAGGMLRFNPS